MSIFYVHTIKLGITARFFGLRNWKDEAKKLGLGSTGDQEFNFKQFLS